MGGVEFEVPIGRARDIRRRVRAYGGVEFTEDTTPFAGTETLSLDVWSGESTESLITLTPTWVDSDTGDYQASFTSAMTEDLSPGIYTFATTCASGGRTGEIDRGSLRLLSVPGSATPPLSFCSLDDMLEYAPWLEDLIAESDLAGFAEQRSGATSWLIDIVAGLWLSDSEGRASAWLPGGLGGSDSGSEQWIRDQLEPLEPDSTPPDSRPERDSTPANFFDSSVSTALLLRPDVVEIVARKAVAFACERQIGRGGDQSYPDLAAKYHALAGNLIRAARFELDFEDPQTGSGVVLRGGVTSRL